MRCGDLRIVMGAKLDLDRTEDEYALMRAARQAQAREVVVATDERRGMPVLQLLHCKIAGINVVDYLTFWERENGRSISIRCSRAGSSSPTASGRAC